MDEYKYLLGRSVRDNPMFAIWRADSPVSHYDMSNKLRFGLVEYAGFVQSTSPAFELTGRSESLDLDTTEEAQAIVDGLDPQSFFTCTVRHFNSAIPVFVYLDAGDTDRYERFLNQLSNAVVAESGFAFNTAQ